MARLICVGLTGGIGCGKTTVARLLTDRRAYLIDTDEAARATLTKGRSVWDRVVKSFGRGILTANGEIDRQKLGAIVFRDPKKRAKLEGIVHPPVRRMWRRALAQYARERRFRVAVVDVPLLYEVNSARLFDAVVVVATSRPTQMKRLQTRGMSRREVEARIAAQWPLQRKIDLADYVVWNDGSRQALRQQVETIWKTISDGNVGVS